MNPLPWPEPHPPASRTRVPHRPLPLSPTDQIVGPLGGSELGPGCRRGCRSDKAGLDTAERTDGA